MPFDLVGMMALKALMMATGVNNSKNNSSFALKGLKRLSILRNCVDVDVNSTQTQREVVVDIHQIAVSLPAILKMDSEITLQISSSNINNINNINLSGQLAGMVRQKHSLLKDSRATLLLADDEDLFRWLARQNNQPTLLIEWPASDQLIRSINNNGLRWAPVWMDSEGVSLEHLRHQLLSIGNEDQTLIFYTTPIGHHPTGVSATVDRRNAVYDLCAQWDALIFENDYNYYNSSNVASYYLTLDSSSCCSDSSTPRVLHIDRSLGVLFGPQFGFPLVIGPPSTTIIDNGSVPANPKLKLPLSILSALLNRFDYASCLAQVNQNISNQRAEFVKRLFADLPALVDEQTPMRGLVDWSIKPALFGPLVWLRIYGLEMRHNNTPNTDIDSGLVYYTSSQADGQWSFHISVDSSRPGVWEQLSKAIKETVQADMQSRNSSRHSSIAMV
jgi:hypothetical protein